MGTSVDQRGNGSRPDMHSGRSLIPNAHNREDALLRFDISGRPYILAGQTAHKIADNPMSYGPFRETYFRLRKSGQFYAGRAITDGDVEVAFVKNNGLRPDQFSLREQDKTRRGKGPVGLSASVLFTDDPEMISVVKFKEPLGEKEHVYKASVRELKALGLEVKIDPTNQNKLHVILSPVGGRFDYKNDIPEPIRIALTELLRSPGHRLEDPMLLTPTDTGSDGGRVWRFGN